MLLVSGFVFHMLCSPPGPRMLSLVGNDDSRLGSPILKI